MIKTIRYQFTLIKWLNLEKTDNSKYWWGYRAVMPKYNLPKYNLGVSQGHYAKWK